MKSTITQRTLNWNISVSVGFLAFLAPICETICEDGALVFLPSGLSELALTLILESKSHQVHLAPTTLLSLLKPHISSVDIWKQSPGYR